MMMRLNLGDLIDRLRRHPADRCVLFDFGGLVPTEIDSYRGYCEDAALGFADGGDATVASLIDTLTKAVGSVFVGHKGGEYTMHEGSRLWVANRGRTSSTAVVDAQGTDWATVLVTQWCDE